MSVTTKITIWVGCSMPNSSADAKMASLLQKPESGGTPEMASVPIKKVQKVMGIFLRSPPISSISCEWTA